MNPFEVTDEQHALRTAVRSFLATECSEDRVRAIMAGPTAHDPDLWRAVALDLGLGGLLVPEVHGGSGAGYVEAAIALEECGRRLLPAPLLATWSAVAVLAELAADSDLLAEIATGASATVAWAEPMGGWTSDAVQCRADDRGRLTGEKRYVVDGAIADLVLVVARCATGLGLYAVRTGTEGVTRRAERTFDRTRSLALIGLDGAAARPLTSGDITASLERALDRISVLLAAEHLGVGQEAFEMAVGYAKQRIQFGRAIGSFQAVKHMCADMLVTAESMRSAAHYAAWAVQDEAEDAALAASLARAFTAEGAYTIAGTNMQVHGGISFTAEHPAHLYLRRAKGALELFGSPRQHRDRVAALLGLVEVAA